MTHKSEDYKISAVKYYLKNKDNIRKTCKIFDCKKSTLQRWIQKYNSTKNLARRNRKPISYKISKPQVNTALDLLKQNEQLTMNELLVDMKNKYPTFNKDIYRQNYYDLQNLNDEDLELHYINYGINENRICDRLL